MRVANEGAGKSSWWMLNPDAGSPGGGSNGSGSSGNAGHKHGASKSHQVRFIRTEET